jgi:uncharacterized protein YciI
MEYCALFYEVCEDFLARRPPLRAVLLRHAQEAHARGDPLLAGAFAGPADRALLVFRCGEASAVEDLARKDPYVANSLASRREVRRWSVVIGNTSENGSALTAWEGFPERARPAGGHS